MKNKIVITSAWQSFSSIEDILPHVVSHLCPQDRSKETSLKQIALDSGRKQGMSLKEEENGWSNYETETKERITKYLVVTTS